MYLSGAGGRGYAVIFGRFDRHYTQSARTASNPTIARMKFTDMKESNVSGLSKKASGVARSRSCFFANLSERLTISYMSTELLKL